MVGMQDASKFNMEEGEFFLIKKIDFFVQSTMSFIFYCSDVPLASHL
jgi:hypothetical protein